MESAIDANLVVFFEGQFCRLAEARISVLTHALHYGTGVFEGIRGYWSEEEQELYLFRAQDHYQRWKANARLLKMQVPFTAQELCDLTRELVTRNRFCSDIYIRPLIYKSRQGIGVHLGPESEFAIVALPFGQYIDSSEGLRVAVSSWRRVDDNAIPARGKICGSYVNSALASDEARATGYDEAIVLTEDGHVAEGAASNIFLLRHGKLVTPPTYDNILEGITRATVIDLAHNVWLETVERRVDRSELYMADEMFFAGTAFEIAPIIEVDGRPVGTGSVGPRTRQLRSIYKDIVRGRNRSWSHWRMPVYHRVGTEVTATH